jgi:O-antigen ligase
MPFGATKTVVFYTLIEVTFPFFLYLFLSRIDWRSWFRQPVVLMLGLFLFVMLVSALLGDDVWNSLFGNSQRLTGFWFSLHLVLYGAYLVLFFALYPQWKIRFLQGVIIVATISAFYGILEGWGWLPSATQNARATSLFGNPIYFASYLVIPLFLSLWQFVVCIGHNRYLFLTSSIVMFGAIIATGTRGVLVGVISGFLLYALFQFIDRPNQRKQIVSIVGGALVAVMLLFMAVSFTAESNSVGERLTRIVDKNVMDRLTYWEIGLRGWVDRPLLGTGPENYYVVSDPVFLPIHYHTSRGLWPDKPHNYFVELLVTTGLIGFGVFVALMVVVAKAMWKHEDNMFSRFVLAGLGAYLVQSFFIFETISASLMFMFLLVLSFSVRLRQSPEKSAFLSLGVGGAGVLSLSLLFL